MSASLLVLPHAGGSRSAFAAFHPAAHVLEYPGHGTDFTGTPLASCAALADWAASRAVDEPTWFGHSLGACVAVAAIERRRELGLAPPRRLIVSSAIPPQAMRVVMEAMDLSGAALAMRFACEGSVDPELLEHPEFAAYIERLLAADFAVAADFARTFTPGRVRAALTGVRVQLLAGRGDPHADVSAMQAWRACCDVEADHVLEGGHFHFLDARASAPLRQLLDAALEPAPFDGMPTHV